MRCTDPPSTDGPTPVLIVITPRLIDALIGAAVVWQRQRKVDGLPHDAELSDLVTALAGVRRGPAGTSLDAQLQPANSEDMTSPLLLTYRQTASRLGVSERQVKRLISGGQLRRVRIGAAARVHVEDLTHYTSALRQETL